MNLAKSNFVNVACKTQTFSCIFNEACNRNLIDRGTLMSSVSTVSQKRDAQRKKEKKDKDHLASKCDANAVQFLNIDFIS